MAKKLHKTAYELKPGERMIPFTEGQTLPEFTLKAAIVGVILGMVFGAANVYLGLKAGLTISTSIPVAVLTVVVFRVFSGNRYSILETNMSQTIGSASSSVASGVLFTLPALFIWGMNPKLWQLTGLAMAGGLLGTLAMVPLRRYLIRDEHGKLPYPEGMACAEVQVAAESGGKQAQGVFWGIGVGLLTKIITGGLKLVPETLTLDLPLRAQLAAKVSPALLGVGYILGLRVGTIMVAGSALSSLVIIPTIGIWGANLTTPFFPETEHLIRDMSAGDLWERYVRYIGAGAVACGGIITLIQSIPAMIESFKVGLSKIGKSDGNDSDNTDRDIQPKVLIILALAVLLALTLIPGMLGYIDTIKARAVAAILIAIFAFFFVTVSSRIVGMVGVTSNPTSGMTIATLIGTSLIFYLLGWTDSAGKATALMVGTVVCVAASIAGDTSQDLKTGYVLGSTPSRQQWGEMLGVITSAGVICLVLFALDRSMTLGSAELPAPQANLMKLVIDGVLDRQLPWNLIFIGVGISLVVFALRLPPLAFAVGVYLPMSTMASVFLGGLLRHLITRKKSEAETEETRERGVLFSSGLVGGEGLTGVVLAIVVLLNDGKKITGLGVEFSPVMASLVAAFGLIAVLYTIAAFARSKKV